MSGSVSLFAERMSYWCEQANLGYDQTQRWTIWNGGECDCSSLVIHCLQEAGFDTGSASWTGDLAENLMVRGWVDLGAHISLACPGDILLRHNYGDGTGHVAAVVSGYGWDAYVGEAWLDEKGGIYYGQGGDQTGLETRVKKIYSLPWDRILRYTEEDDMTPEELMDFKIKTVEGDPTPYYQFPIWSLKYGKETYYTVQDIKTELGAMYAAMETLAASKGADAAEIAAAVQKAVKAKLATLKAPEIDYEALASAIAEKLPQGADSAEIAKATANELYKRLKA